MSYALEYSIDGQHWRTVPEKRTYSDCPGTGIRNVPVTRERLQDIQREAEFWSHRYPHIRIKHPEVRASDMRDGDIYFWKYADVKAGRLDEVIV